MDVDDMNRISDLVAQIEQLEAEVGRYHRQIELERTRHIEALDAQRRRADSSVDAIRVEHAERVERLRLAHHAQLTEVRLSADAAISQADARAIARVEEVTAHYELAVAGESQRLTQAVADSARMTNNAMAELTAERQQLDRERERIRADIATVRDDRDAIAAKLAETERRIETDRIETNEAHAKLSMDLDAATLALDELRAAHATAVRGREDRDLQFAKDRTTLERELAAAREKTDSTVRRLTSELNAERRRAESTLRRIERQGEVVRSQRSELERLQAQADLQRKSFEETLLAERSAAQSAHAEAAAAHARELHAVEARVEHVITELEQGQRESGSEADAVRTKAAEERSRAIAQLAAVRAERDADRAHNATLAGDLAALQRRLKGVTDERDLDREAHEAIVSELQATIAEIEQRRSEELAEFEEAIADNAQALAAAQTASAAASVAAEARREATDKGAAKARKQRAELERRIEELGGRVRFLDAQRLAEASDAEARIAEIRAAAEAQCKALEERHLEQLQIERRRRDDEIELAIARLRDEAKPPTAQVADARLRDLARARIEALTAELNTQRERAARAEADLEPIAAERDRLQTELMDAENWTNTDDEQEQRLRRGLDATRAMLARESARSAAERQRLVEENLRLARALDDLRAEAINRVSDANTALSEFRQSVSDRLRRMSVDANERARTAEDRAAAFEDRARESEAVALRSAAQLASAQAMAAEANSRAAEAEAFAQRAVQREAELEAAVDQLRNPV